MIRSYVKIRRTIMTVHSMGATTVRMKYSIKKKLYFNSITKGVDVFAKLWKHLKNGDLVIKSSSIFYVNYSEET